MKFWLSLMPIQETGQLVEIARFAEELGYHGITMADHLVMPTRIESKYPYTEDGKMWWPPDTPWLDPWITLAAMGTATHRLRLGTNIYLGALRDPFTVAKAVATLAALCGDRVMCGLSVGWIKEEYDLAGIDFPSRGRRMDELITVMKKLWAGQEVSHQGEFFRFEHAAMHPAPARPVPIWCGGGSAPALRRAALNDGWLGVPLSLTQLKPVIASMQQTRREAGLPLDSFSPCVALAQALKPAVVEELQTLGIHDTTCIAPWMMSPWGATKWIDDGDDPRQLDVKKKAMERFANLVIRQFA